MPGFKLWARTILIGFTVLFLSITSVNAGTIQFSGSLDVIELDTGGGVYTGTPIGTNFNGSINEISETGVITDGTTATAFGCCIAAGGLDVSNNITLKAGDAALLNSLSGSSFFSAGDKLDVIDIEGDTTTAGGGRIEIGLSYIFAKNTFSNNSPNNYPFDPDDVLLSLFFIVEEDSLGDEIYSVVGQLTDSTIPAAWQNYDNFNAKIYSGCKFCINSEKWIGSERSGSNDTEVLREIKSKRLHMSQRTWGNSDSDTGTVQGRNRLRFRDSADISGVCFTPRIRKYGINNCAENGSTGAVRIRYVGTFFDADDEVDDGEIGTVYGWFDMIRFGNTTDKKGTFEIQGYADECQDVDCQVDNWSTYDGTNDPDLFFGTVKGASNKKAMCIAYDRVGHELVFSYGNDVRVVGAAHDLPAFEADMVSRNTWHVIEVRNDVENCTAGRISGFVDGDVDNVKIKEYQ
jgi:hypothetical protein